ncbi:MAG TPA: uracil-DNA glycosylase [Polyangia bacterium]
MTDFDFSEDPRSELRALVAGFRTLLEAQARSGALGVPMPVAPLAARPATAAPSAPPARLPVVVEAPVIAEGPRGAEGLAAVRADLGDCTRCKLCKGRRNIVFGVGNPNAELVFVGEAPGGDEDIQGEPFVGAAGQLLTKMIAAMGFARSDVYICNVIKCRPPNNRNPEPDEVAACEPFLKAQLAALRPRMIVTLGKFASQSICREQTPITRLRGNLRVYEGIPVMPTYHPAYLLRTPEAKREAWADLQAVLAQLAQIGITPPQRPRAG